MLAKDNQSKILYLMQKVEFQMEYFQIEILSKYFIIN